MHLLSGIGVAGCRVMGGGNERGYGMSRDGNHRRHARHNLLGRLFHTTPTGRTDEAQDRLLQTCPECEESVYILAERCRHCGNLLTPARVA
jgi:hypothetical protein